MKAGRVRQSVTKIGSETTWSHLLPELFVTISWHLGKALRHHCCLAFQILGFWASYLVKFWFCASANSCDQSQQGMTECILKSGESCGLVWKRGRGRIARRLQEAAFHKLFLTLSSAIAAPAAFASSWQICNFPDARSNHLSPMCALQIWPTGRRVDFFPWLYLLGTPRIFSTVQGKLSFPLKRRLKTHVLRNLL